MVKQPLNSAFNVQVLYYQQTSYVSQPRKGIKKTNNTHSLTKRLVCLCISETHIHQGHNLFWRGLMRCFSFILCLSRTVDIYRCKVKKTVYRTDQDLSGVPGSSMCSNNHSMAACGSWFPVANNAFWERNSEKPIDSNWPIAASLNGGKERAAREGPT